MKKILSLVLALVMVLSVLPVKAQAKAPDYMPLDIGDHTYREVESNDSPNQADVIYNDYTIVGGLSPYDLMDYYYFELSSRSNVVIPMIAQYDSMLYGIFDEYAEECLAVGLFQNYTDDYESFFMLDTTLPAGEYYLVVMDDDAYYNDYTYYVEITSSGGGHTHNYYYDYSVSPYCTSEGYSVYTCSCGDYYYDDYTPALGHDFVNGYCSRCGTEDPNYSEPTDPGDHPDVGDIVFNEVESNNSTGMADSIGNYYTVNAGLTTSDLIDFFRFTLEEESDVLVVTLAQYDSLMMGIMDTSEEFLAAATYDGRSDNGKSYFVMDTTLPAGTYYIVVMDEDDYYNSYTFFLECTPVGGGHVHDFVYAFTVPSTCQEGGYDVYMCECGEEYEDNYQPVGTHEYNEGTCIYCGEEDPDYTDIQTGSCGDNATFTLTPDGTMTISGSGNAYRDYWHDLDYDIVHLVVESGITAIGTEMFMSCDLESVILADTVKHIGNSAFQSCHDLSSVTLSNSLETIGEDAFSACHALTTISLPVSLTSIGSGAFGGTDLTTVYYAGSMEQWAEVTVADSTVADAEIIFAGGHTHNYVDGKCTVCGEEDPNYTEPVENPFTDVAESDYFFAPVMWAVENGITSGLNATTFGPNNPCTRAQVVTFLWRAAGQPEPTSTNNPFTDVSSADYFYKPVLWAVENGITSGMSATTFGPNSTCTRGQVVTFLWRAAGLPAPASNENPFGDVASADYFYNPVLWAVENGITAGLNATTFGAGNPCTRGQVVTFLFRADGVETPDEPDEPTEPTTPPTEPEPTVPGVDEYPDELPGWEPGTESGYYACPYVPDFGAFAGVVPSSITTTANSATFVYKTSEVNASAGSSALMDYISLLEDWGFYPAGTDNGFIRYDSGGDVQINLSATSEATRENITLTIYEYSFGHTYSGDGAFSTKAYESCSLVPDFGAIYHIEPSYMTVDGDSAYYIYDLDEVASGALDDYMNLLANDCEFYIITQGSNGMVFQHDHMDVSVFYAASYSSSGNYVFVKVFGEDYTGTSEPDEPDEPTEPTVPPTEPPTQPTEPPTQPTEPEPTEPGRELQRDELEITLRIPTNGGFNYYAEVKAQNYSDMDILFPSMFSLNGKLVNLYEDYSLSGGYQTTLTYYRAIIPSERWEDKWEDMYLDNNSIGVMVIEWNSDQYYVEFGVNGIVEFYRGNVNGPATDPVGPDPEVPTEPTVPPTEPEPSDIVYYANNPAVPDLGVIANADLLMGGDDGNYYYSWYDVSDEEMNEYKDLLEECGFVFQKTTYGTIIDFDYDTYKHSTMDISVDVGYWKGNPLGNLAVVQIEGSDAGKAPSGGGSTEPGMQYYPNAAVVPDFGAWAGVELADEYGIYNGVCYNYSIELTDELSADYISLLLEEGFTVQFAFENEMSDYQVFWHPDEDLSVEFGTSLHPEWGWVTFVSVYVGDPRDPGYYSYEDYPAVPDFGSYVGAILMADSASTKGDGTCYLYDISLYEEWEQSYYELLVDKGFDVQYYTEDTDYYYEVFWHPDADVTVEFGKINDPDRGWVTFVEVYAGEPAEPDHYGPAPEEPEPTEPESDPLNPDPDDVPAYLTYTGYGDDVITGIELPAGEWYCEYFNNEDRYFSIKFFYGNGEYDYTLLANESDICTGQSLLEDTLNVAVNDGMLEVQASGSWTVHFKRVSGTTTTNIRGYGDIVTGTFVATSSRNVFHLTNAEDRYFCIKVFKVGGDKYDYELLANESDPYSGNVSATLEVGQEYFFVVEASGEWTIDMGQGDALTTYVQPDGVGGTGGGSNPGGDTPGGGSGTIVGYDVCPSVPDFGVFVGVEPEWDSILDTTASFTYKSSKVYAAAGSNAVTDYLNLLEDLGFYLAGGYASTVIYKNDALGLTVSVGATTISSGEYISVMMYGDGYPC